MLFLRGSWAKEVFAFETQETTLIGFEYRSVFDCGTCVLGKKFDSQPAAALSLFFHGPRVFGNFTESKNVNSSEKLRPPLVDSFFFLVESDARFLFSSLQHILSLELAATKNKLNWINWKEKVRHYLYVDLTDNCSNYQECCKSVKFLGKFMNWPCWHSDNFGVNETGELSIRQNRLDTFFSVNTGDTVFC